MYGDFNSESEFWSQVSPINYLDKIKGAIGLYHAVNDQVVSVEYSRNLNNILSQTGIPHELNQYPSGGHNIDGSSFIRAMQDTVEFFNRNLK